MVTSGCIYSVQREIIKELMVERKLTQTGIQSTGVRALSPFFKKLFPFQNSKIFFRFISVLQQLMDVSWEKEIEKEKKPKGEENKGQD